MKRNYKNYLLAILSMLIICITIAVITVYIDNVITLSYDIYFHELKNIYRSIRTIFTFGGIAFVVQQYLVILKSSRKDYCVLKALGATRHNIQTLIFTQVLTIVMITIPVGFLSGSIITSLFVNCFNDFTIGTEAGKLIDAYKICFIISGIVCCIVAFIGVYVERRIWCTPLSSIISDQQVFRKDTEDIW